MMRRPTPLNIAMTAICTMFPSRKGSMIQVARMKVAVDDGIQIAVGMPNLYSYTISNNSR